MSKKSREQSRAERAVEVQAAQAKRERNRRWGAIGAVVAVMALIVGGAILVSVLTKEDVEPADVGASEYGLVYGSNDAPHEVVIYEDFLCSHCASLEEAAGEGLTRLADKGKVLIDYRPIAFLGEDSARTLNAFKAVLEESGPEVAKEFHDSLFDQFAAAPLGDDELVELAVDAGADEAAVRDAITNLTYSDWVEDATADAQAQNVSGTPTVVLDGEQFTDGRSAAEIGENLVDELE